MNLKDAKLGDRYRVFLNADREMISQPSMHTIPATVIAISKPEIGTGLILGWLPDETHPLNAGARTTGSTENDYVPSQASYTYGKRVSFTHLVAIKIVNGVDGFPCRRCRNFYEYAVPNREDGTLLCWSCRHTW